MVQNEHDVRLGGVQVCERIGQKLVAHGGDVLNLNDLRRTEQGGRSVQDQLPRRVGGGVNLNAVHLRVDAAEQLTQACRSAGGEVLLRAVEHDGGCRGDSTPRGVEGGAASAGVASGTTTLG